MSNAKKGTKPSWLTAADVMAPEAAHAAEEATGTTYTLKDGSVAVTVSARIARKNAHQMLIPLPGPVKERLDAAVEGGSMSGAIVGLVVFALDELERQGKRIIINIK